MRTSPRLKRAFLYSIVAAAAAVAGLFPRAQDSAIAGAERFAFDAQMQFLRAFFPRTLENDVVLIGTDIDTEQAFPEPIALWHAHLAKVYRALAVAKPLAVGVDIGLPERSFDWVRPGIDAAMMRGIVALKAQAPVVFVQHSTDRDELAPVQENLRSIVEPSNLGVDRQLKDPDGVSRRFAEALRYETGAPVPTLAGQLLRRLGRPVGEGYIDYSIGGPPLRYIPIHEIGPWLDAGDEKRLKERFAGRIVLIGSMTGDRDRWFLPAAVIELPEDVRRGDAPGARISQPGVAIHLQVLRSHLSRGLLAPSPEWLVVALCAVAALATLARARPAMVIGCAVAVPLALFAASLLAIRQWQVLLPAASMTLVFWIGLAVRGTYDAVASVLARIRMQRTFAGQVSPAVMREMLHGHLASGVSAQLADICVLFSDVRDFTSLSERMAPEIVTNVLQRYFDRMVHAVHKFDGTVDKFIGDGLMVLFGAPRKSEDPCGDAVQCALAMMAELDLLNAEFEREGLPTLTIGIGVNYGTVTVGNIGSTERHNYSAIGDAVNVAARVEGLTKELGRKIVITEAVVSRIGERFHFDPLGEHKLKGHSPVRVWGIRTARATPAVT